MNYKQVKDANNIAWESFMDSLQMSGFTVEQVVKLMRLIDNKDCLNDVMGCVMEVAFLEGEE
jgi:hypothetical protein